MPPPRVGQIRAAPVADLQTEATKTLRASPLAPVLLLMCCTCRRISKYRKSSPIHRPHEGAGFAAQASHPVGALDAWISPLNEALNILDVLSNRGQGIPGNPGVRVGSAVLGSACSCSSNHRTR